MFIGIILFSIRRIMCFTRATASAASFTSSWYCASPAWSCFASYDLPFFREFIRLAALMSPVLCLAICLYMPRFIQVVPYGFEPQSNAEGLEAPDISFSFASSWWCSGHGRMLQMIFISGYAQSFPLDHSSEDKMISLGSGQFSRMATFSAWIDTGSAACRASLHT